MISFKKFLLIEKWEHSLERNAISLENGKVSSSFHRDTVKGHKIVVQFNRMRHDNYDNADVSFSVDGSISKDHNNLPTHHAMHILHHIKNVVKEYTKTKSPKSLTFHSIDSTPEHEKKKQELYNKFAGKLGHASSDEFGTSVVKLKEAIEEYIKELNEEING